MALIQIRFNTKYKEGPDESFKWRILVDGEEFLAKSVTIITPSFSTEDVLPTGEIKHHMTTRGILDWKNGNVTILSEPSIDIKDQTATL